MIITRVACGMAYGRLWGEKNSSQRLSAPLRVAYHNNAAATATTPYITAGSRKDDLPLAGNTSTLSAAHLLLRARLRVARRVIRRTYTHAPPPAHARDHAPSATPHLNLCGDDYAACTREVARYYHACTTSISSLDSTRRAGTACCV